MDELLPRYTLRTYNGSAADTDFEALMRRIAGCGGRWQNKVYILCGAHFSGKSITMQKIWQEHITSTEDKYDDTSVMLHLYGSQIGENSLLSVIKDVYKLDVLELKQLGIAARLVCLIDNVDQDNMEKTVNDAVNLAEIAKSGKNKAKLRVSIVIVSTAEAEMRSFHPSIVSVRTQPLKPQSVQTFLQKNRINVLVSSLSGIFLNPAFLSVYSEAASNSHFDILHRFPQKRIDSFLRRHLEDSEVLRAFRCTGVMAKGGEKTSVMLFERCVAVFMTAYIEHPGEYSINSLSYESMLVGPPFYDVLTAGYQSVLGELPDIGGRSIYAAITGSIVEFLLYCRAVKIEAEGLGYSSRVYRNYYECMAVYARLLAARDGKEVCSVLAEALRKEQHHVFRYMCSCAPRDVLAALPLAAGGSVLFADEQQPFAVTVKNLLLQSEERMAAPLLKELVCARFKDSHIGLDGIDLSRTDMRGFVFGTDRCGMAA